MQLPELVQFLPGVEVFNMEVVLGSLDEFAVLLREGFPVSEVAHSETESEDLGGVAGTNALESGADDGLAVILLLDFCDFVGLAVDVRDQSGSEESIVWLASIKLPTYLLLMRSLPA